MAAVQQCCLYSGDTGLQLLWLRYSSAACIRVTLDINLNSGLTHVVAFLSDFRHPFIINDHEHFPSGGYYNLKKLGSVLWLSISVYVLHVSVFKVIVLNMCLLQ